MTKTKGGDAGRGEVQRTVDGWNEVGYRGIGVDPTPNEAYTVAGVISGAATPQTDADLQAEAAEASGLHSVPLEAEEQEPDG